MTVIYCNRYQFLILDFEEDALFSNKFVALKKICQNDYFLNYHKIAFRTTGDNHLEIFIF